MVKLNAIHLSWAITFNYNGFYHPKGLRTRKRNSTKKSFCMAKFNMLSFPCFQDLEGKAKNLYFHWAPGFLAY